MRGPEEGNWGREEGEEEQERVYLVMTPFLSATGGGDQENTTSLSPATAVNPTGEPDGAEREILFSKTAELDPFCLPTEI